MALIFKVGGNTISEQVRPFGLLFVRQSKDVERLFEFSSGVGDIVSDEVTIDTEILWSFIARLLQIIDGSNNRTMATLLGGYIAMAINLLRLAGAKSEFPGIEIASPIRVALAELEGSPNLRPPRPKRSGL